jgi:hypothetical protein
MTKAFCKPTEQSPYMNPIAVTGETVCLRPKCSRGSIIAGHSGAFKILPKLVSNLIHFAIR